jgi:hypothetical protein
MTRKKEDEQRGKGMNCDGQQEEKKVHDDSGTSEPAVRYI